MRRANLRTIALHLHRRGACSRSDLGRHTGLTRTTVADLVAELEGLGLVYETLPDPDGRRGRPSSMVNPGPHNLVLGIDLMVDQVGVVAVALGGQVVGADRRSRDRSDLSLTRTLELVRELVDRVRADLAPEARILAVGVAVPGLVSKGSQQLVVAPNLDWLGVEVVDEIEAVVELAVPVFVANEADLGALAEHRRGQAQGRSPILYVSGEVGIGGGVLYGGRVGRGRRGYAGEIGHMPVNPDGRSCRCGSRGCFETEVGEETLLARAGLDPTGGSAAVDALLAAAEAGEPAVLAALDEHARWLAVGLVGVVATLDPEIVVLGGLQGAVLPHVRHRLDLELGRRYFPRIGLGLPPVVASLGPDGLARGAAELAWDGILSPVGDGLLERTA